MGIVTTIENKKTKLKSDKETNTDESNTNDSTEY